MWSGCVQRSGQWPSQGPIQQLQQPSVHHQTYARRCHQGILCLQLLPAVDLPGQGPGEDGAQAKHPHGVICKHEKNHCIPLCFE